MNKPKKFDLYHQGYLSPKFKHGQNWYFAWLKFIKKKINLEPFKKKKIIDLGGGIGAFSTLLQKEGFKNIICNDISPQALKLAKKFNSSLKTACFDIEKIKAKNKYDLIFAFEVLEHLDNPQKAVKTIFGLLKKEGVFIGSTPYPFPKNFQDPTHQHVLKPEKWQNFFQEAGFRHVSIYPLSFPPFLYRLSKYLNFYLPWYIKNRLFVSTTLIITKKDG